MAKANVGCVGGGAVQRNPEKRLYRIPRVLPDDGGLRTFQEAQAIAKEQAWWAAGAAYVGCDARHYCWQQL